MLFLKLLSNIQTGTSKMCYMDHTKFYMITLIHGMVNLKVQSWQQLFSSNSVQLTSHNVLFELQKQLLICVLQNIYFALVATIFEKLLWRSRESETLLKLTSYRIVSQGFNFAWLQNIHITNCITSNQNRLHIVIHHGI